ncbi:endonuclease domain-containing protein [Blastococcus sp. SYSU DS0616]
MKSKTKSEPLLRAEAAARLRKRQNGLCAVPKCGRPLPSQDRWTSSPEGALVGLVCYGHSLVRMSARALDANWLRLWSNPPAAGLVILPPGARNWKRPWSEGAPDLTVDLAADASFDPPRTWSYSGTPVEVLFELQERRCAICLNPLAFWTGRNGYTAGVHVDHHYVWTDQAWVPVIRGLLCARCNTNLGRTSLLDHWWGPVLQRRQAYLENPPAQQWDLTSDLIYGRGRPPARVGDWSETEMSAVTDVLLAIAGQDQDKIDVAVNRDWFDWYYAGTAVHALLVEQAGVCAVSEQDLNPPRRFNGRPTVNAATLDHGGPDRRRGPLRGLITPTWNGRLRESGSGETRWDQARPYLDDPPAQRSPYTNGLCYSAASNAWLVPDARPQAPGLSPEEVVDSVRQTRAQEARWRPNLWGVDAQ